MVVLLLSPRSGVVTGSVIDWDQIVIGGQTDGCHIAVIGLGRIGAFHAETLSGLAGVDELVVTMSVPR